ncbi:MAG: cell filamentation protein Fic [Planctomycetes bacterium]|nr:cell filamentation protein Fic [Planctomycetota bacterium]
MKRGDTGIYTTTAVGGEQVRAFIPAPLPPKPSIDLQAIQAPLEAATLALGRLDALTLAALLPETGLFLYYAVRKEAVLSSQIEGTQSSLSELLLFEASPEVAAPLDDVVEVSNYVAALEHGLARLKAGFPLSNRLLREAHEVLLSRGRGSDKQPGEFRRSQNWIGGTRPGNAHFVPPPPHEVVTCMGDLERFLHATDTQLPALVRAGVAHLQFETIHPFLDGNGRVGRLLISLMLHHERVLAEPMLYLSLYFKQHRDRYYQHLDQVRETGDWEDWLTFFLDGVAATAQAAVATAQRLRELFAQDRERIQAMKGANSLLRVHRALQARPITSVQEVCEREGMTFATASRGIAALESIGMVAELTGFKRNRRFAYQDYLAILREGTELE